MDFSFSKQGLLDALEARRSWAESLDKRQASEHKKAEKAAVDKFRAKCREALKWDYEQIKAFSWDYRSGRDWITVPTCPKSNLQSLDIALKQIQRDGRTRYRITPKAFANIHYLLSYDETAKPDVCT